MANRVKVLGAAVAVAGIYGWWVRPRLWRWGATDEELAAWYPGAEFVPGGERAATMAVTVNAPPGHESIPPAAQAEGRSHGLLTARSLPSSRPSPLPQAIYLLAACRGPSTYLART